MRFLVDECTGPAVARWLRNQQHEVFSVYEEARRLLARCPGQLQDHFVVVSEAQVRFAQT